MTDRIDHYTYMVRHNPNCPSPFEVRTAGDAGLVEAREPRNLITYGKTFDEAAARMLIAINQHKRQKKEQFAAQERDHLRRLFERRFEGAVWA